MALARCGTCEKNKKRQFRTDTELRSRCREGTLEAIGTTLNCGDATPIFIGAKVVWDVLDRWAFAEPNRTVLASELLGTFRD